MLLEKNPSVAEFMSTVLSIHEKFTHMIREVFGSHKAFVSALDKVSQLSMKCWEWSGDDRNQINGVAVMS